METLRLRLLRLDVAIQSRTTIRNRLTLVIVLCTAGGAGLGWMFAGEGYPAGALGLTGLALMFLCVRWACHAVAAPVERLAKHVEALAQGGTPMNVRQLPVKRTDKIGEIARSVRSLSLRAMRTSHEERLLRRTLDQRVERQTRKATARLRRLAMRDPLTGLGNRRFMDEQMCPVVRRCLDTHSPLVCMVMDLDRFKRINDTHGHATGDQVLIRLARAIDGEVRDSDFAARFGGDEFVVVLVGATLSAGRARAQSIRNRFVDAVRKLGLPADTSIDVSVGLSSLDHDDAADFEQLMHAADANLYEVKAKHHAASDGFSGRLAA